jgi:hypothetical protein
MRIILFVLILLVAALLIAIASGLISITQTRPAHAPDVQVGREGVETKGGQAPAFDIETGTLSVGTAPRDVPTVTVQPADRGAQDNSTQPAAPQPR